MGAVRDYGASQPVDTIQHLIDDIKRFGRYPKRGRNNKIGNALADRLKKVMKTNKLNAAQKYDIDSLPGGPLASFVDNRAEKLVNEVKNRAEKLLDEVKALGHYPRESKTNLQESQLAQNLRKAIKSGVFQPAEIAELEDLRKRSVHPIDLARSAQLIKESGKHRKRQAQKTASPSRSGKHRKRTAKIKNAD